MEEKELLEITEEAAIEEEAVIEEEAAAEFEPIIEEPQEIHPADIQPQKNNKNMAVVIITLLFMSAVGLCIFIAVSLSDVISEAEKQPDAEYESESGNPWEEILGEDFLNKDEEAKSEETDVETPNVEEVPYTEEVPEIELPDVQLPEINEEDPLEPYYSDITEDYPNYARDTFDGPYYPNIVNSIDEEVSYKIDRVSGMYKNPMYDVMFVSSYVELSGDIPNLEEINAAIRDDVMSFEENYKADGDRLNEQLHASGISCYGESEAYVTYNTEDKISIVIRKSIEIGYMTTSAAVYCYNIDLTTGEILKNSSIIKLDDSFGKEFREKSNLQNGLSDSTEKYTDEQILAMLRDDRSLILFYTPLGLEIGYNHNSGWITITLQDYEKYIALR